MNTAEETPARPGGGGGGVYVSGLLLLVAAAFALTVLVRAWRSSAESEGAERAAEVAAGPRVIVVPVGRSSEDRVLRVLGEARPFYETTLYSKLSGYLRQIRVDRGDRVTEGQLLAVIEAPETEQQYEAALAEASNRRSVAARARALVGPGIVSTQDAEQAETNRRTAQANVGLVAVQRGYRELHAPFAGVITARFADPGALVQSATGSQVGALPIVRVSEVDRLRVFAYLEQRDAALVRVGDTAEVGLPERPDVHVTARVARLAGELDNHTRTLLTEVDVDNRAGTITPGSFAQVTLRLRAPVYPEVPSEALVVRGTRTFVAVVGDDSRVHFHPVELVDDDGAHVRVASGVAEGERVALSLGDAVEDGARVQPTAPPARAHGAAR